MEMLIKVASTKTGKKSKRRDKRPARARYWATSQPDKALRNVPTVSIQQVARREKGQG